MPFGQRADIARKRDTQGGAVLNEIQNSSLGSGSYKPNIAPATAETNSQMAIKSLQQKQQPPPSPGQPPPATSTQPPQQVVPGPYTTMPPLVASPNTQDTGGQYGSTGNDNVAAPHNPGTTAAENEATQNQQNEPQLTETPSINSVPSSSQTAEGVINNIKDGPPVKDQEFEDQAKYLRDQTMSQWDPIRKKLVAENVAQQHSGLNAMARQGRGLGGGYAGLNAGIQAQGLAAQQSAYGNLQNQSSQQAMQLLQQRMEGKKAADIDELRTMFGISSEEL